MRPSGAAPGGPGKTKEALPWCRHWRAEQQDTHLGPSRRRSPLHRGSGRGRPGRGRPGRRSAPPERAVRACLQIGARASTAAGASLDTLVVEKAFDGLVDGFSTTVSEAVEPDRGHGRGPGRRGLRTAAGHAEPAQGRADHQLDALFDPDSKSSALARMEAGLRRGGGLRRPSRSGPSLDPANDKSPLGQWKAEVLGTVREQVGLVLTQLTEVAATVAASDARAKTFALTASRAELRRPPPPLISMPGDAPRGPGRTCRAPARLSRVTNAATRW